MLKSIRHKQPFDRSKNRGLSKPAAVFFILHFGRDRRKPSNLGTANPLSAGEIVLALFSI